MELRQSPDSSPGIPIWDVAILRDALTTGPNVHPRSTFQTQARVDKDKPKRTLVLIGGILVTNGRLKELLPWVRFQPDLNFGEVYYGNHEGLQNKR